MTCISQKIESAKQIYFQAKNGFEQVKANKTEMYKLAAMTAAAAIGAGLFVAFLGTPALGSIVVAGTVALAVFAKRCYDNGDLSLQLDKIVKNFKRTEIHFEMPKADLTILGSGSNPGADAIADKALTERLIRLNIHGKKDLTTSDVEATLKKLDKPLFPGLSNFDLSLPERRPRRYTEINVDENGKEIGRSEVEIMEWVWPKKP